MSEGSAKSGFLLVFGTLWIILGIIAISAPLMTTLALAIIVGWVFIFGGAGQIIGAFANRVERGWPFQLLIGLLYLGAGFYLLRFPVGGAMTLAFFIGMLVLLAGILKIALALHMRGMPNWGWTLLSGVLSLLLGILIWRRPVAAAWFIGLLVGINILFIGWSMVSAGLAARKAA